MCREIHWKNLQFTYTLLINSLDGNLLFKFSTRPLQVVETSKEFFLKNQNSCRAQCDKYSIIEGNFKFLPQCILTIGILKINRQSRIEIKKSESILTEGRHFRSKISKLCDV